jgi:uncharacterized protein YaiI (UPF0178 family)
MEIWVDADACPGVIREIIAKAAHKRAINTTFVANHSFSLAKSPHVRLYQVPIGFDEADKEIERRVSEGDLVITADIPLASDVLEKSALVLTPRGERYTEGAELNTHGFPLMRHWSRVRSYATGIHNSSSWWRPRFGRIC